MDGNYHSEMMRTRGSRQDRSGLFGYRRRRGFLSLRLNICLEILDSLENREDRKGRKLQMRTIHIVHTGVFNHHTMSQLCLQHWKRLNDSEVKL